jgi:LysR family nitrogen assimilation transcriptional regulator
MDLKQLRHFRQVAQSGSFSAAAGVLRIAQPALSRQIRALELDLGVTLFHRNGRGITPTAAGQALLADAARLLDDAQGIAKRMRDFGDRLSGEATIGLSSTVSRLLTLPLATRVRSDFPDLRLRIVEGFSGTLLEWLQTGRLDAAILFHVPSGSALRSEIVAEEVLSIIAPSDDRSFPPGAAVPITALAGKPLVLPTPAHGLRQRIDDHAARAGVRLDLLFEFDSLDSIIALVRQGMAMTILPEAVVRAELDGGGLTAWRIGDPELVRPLVIATAAQRADAIGTAELAELLRSVILSAAPTWNWRTRRPG